MDEGGPLRRIKFKSMHNQNRAPPSSRTSSTDFLCPTHRTDRTTQ
jgi:hypothetical protein